MNRAPLPKAWRYVAAGLALSVAAAFGLVDLASAHARPDGVMPAGMQRGPVPAMAGLGLPLAGPMMDRMLDQIQATPEQRDQLRRIAETAQADLQAPGEAARADHARLGELLAQPTLDTAAIETLRKQMVARHDQASRRMTVALLEAARVLTPEQRQQLAAIARQHAERIGAGTPAADAVH